MSIKEKLFGKPWQHKDPTLRARSVAESDDPDLRDDLGRLAEHDESADVRLAALRRIDTEPFWLDARLRDSGATIVKAADDFLFKAVMQRANEDLLKERREWLRRIDDSEFLRRVACHAPDRAMRQDALARIDSPGFLGDRIVEEADETTALSLVARIDQTSTLERIAGALRRKSKRRAQAVEERLHALQAARGEYDAAGESASRLIQRAERLARGQFEGSRQTEYEELEKLWEQLESPSESRARRFRGAMDIVRRSLEAPSRPISKPAAEGPGPETAGADPALAEIVGRLERIENSDGLGPDRAGALLGEFDRAWEAIEDPRSADEALRERALPILKTLQRQRQESSAPPAEKPSPPQSDTTDWPRELDAAAALLESGDIVRAQAELRALRSRLDRLPPRQRPREASGRLGRLEGRLREMRDWEHWSHNQHRDELIERVEQLVDSGQHPDAISAALKEARSEWQRLEALEVLPGDKRQHAAPPAQWRRFQAACQQAFEQAQPFFEKRHEVQAENLEQLEAFLARGRSVAEAEDSDIETLKGFMRKSRQAIRRLDDLPPKSRGRAAAGLREVMDRISERLDDAFELIENAKRRLVREAQALQHEPDLKSAIDQAKALQARWQKTGTGRRRIEQALWKEFRAPIDPLFEKLRGESEQRREEQEAELAKLRELVEQAEALAEIDDQELEQAPGRMKALRSDWEAAGRRPGQLSERFERADRALRKRLEDQRRSARRRELERVEALAENVQAAWQARQAGETPAIEMDETPTEDEFSRALQAAARALADPATDDSRLARQVDENGVAARRVLIEMEFLAGLESPAEDREARMSFQVERLAQRMSERGEAPGLAEELADLRHRWYSSFPHPADQHPDMAMRFRKCQNVLESMSGTQ